MLGGAAVSSVGIGPELLDSDAKPFSNGGKEAVLQATVVRTMHYYYRFFPDGSCDIICTRCFLKIGKGQESGAARMQADQHICQVGRGAARVASAAVEQQTMERVSRRARGFEVLSLPVPYMVLLAVLLFYVLPTLLEIAVLQHASLWAFGILFGDLSGCIGIFVALKKKKLAVVLYLALTAVECWLYSAQILSAHSLVWLMDAVPTAIMAGAILRPRARLARLRA